MRSEICGLVGLNIRAIRKGKKLTLEDLSFALDIHRNYLGDLERGRRNPSLLTLVKISRGLGTPLSKLLKKTPPGAHEYRNSSGSERENLCSFLAGIYAKHTASEKRFITKLISQVSAGLLALKK